MKNLEWQDCMLDNIKKLEKYAEENNVPIMMKDGIEFLLEFIKENNIKNVLEIGSAIGYSAIRMALLDENIKVTTIERDNERYNEAVKNIKDFNLESQITIINDDAFNVELNEKYDLIFIDAAKSQYIKFFEKFKINLSDNGYIVSDNLNFHGLTKTDSKDLSRNVRGLVRKLNSYVEFLKNNTEFSTAFYDVGDGVSISQRKEVIMNKKGFTLVELLGVIVILAAVMLIAFPPILNQIQKSQLGIDSATKKLVLSAAKLYVDENQDTFKKMKGNVYCTEIDTLIDSGHLTEGMISGTENIKDKAIVKISYTDSFSYDVVPLNQCENVLRLCSLVSGEPNKVGSKYLCDLGKEKRSFYVLEEGNEKKDVVLILEGNYDDEKLPWCQSVGNNKCAASGLTTKLDEIAEAWTKIDRSQIGIPSIEQIVVADGQDEDAYLDYPTLSSEWLYKNADGSSVGHTGYWTSTPYGGDTESVWLVYYDGMLNDIYANNHGVRPMISVLLSDI